MITIESTADVIHGHIPRAEMSEERLDQILNGIRLETTVAGNQLTDAEADCDGGGDESRLVGEE